MGKREEGVGQQKRRGKKWVAGAERGGGHSSHQFMPSVSC